MPRPTKIVVNLEKLKKNYLSIKNKVNRKILALVKADAYGHGLVKCSKALQDIGVDYLGTASLEEGVTLRKEGITVPILCVGVLPPESERLCVEYDIEQAISTIDELLRVKQAANDLNKTIGIHIKIETGMHRSGVRYGCDLDELLKEIKKCTLVKLKGVFTHFAESDTTCNEYTQLQSNEFKKAVDYIKKQGFDDVLVHCANSGAILQYPDLYFDMVRAGIILYGYYPSKDVKQTIKIEPILSCKTKVVAINKLFKDECVSYGCTYTAKRDMLVAILPIGYGDGYKRLISNRGYALIKGIKAPVIGRVCMDMTMIDVTDVKDIKIGDEVVLLGAQGDALITADDLASWCETINYEIMLSFTQRVPKEYVE